MTVNATKKSSTKATTKSSSTMRKEDYFQRQLQRRFVDPIEIDTNSFSLSSHEQKRRTPTRVSFQDSVTVRCYNTVLGDNPSVHSGPPVSLGWTVVETSHHPLATNNIDNNTPNKKKKIHLPVATRIARLKENGFAWREQAIVMDECRTIRSQRASSSQLNNSNDNTNRTKVTHRRTSPLRKLPPTHNTEFRRRERIGALLTQQPEHQQEWRLPNCLKMCLDKDLFEPLTSVDRAKFQSLSSDSLVDQKRNNSFFSFDKISLLRNKPAVITIQFC